MPSGSAGPQEVPLNSPNRTALAALALALFPAGPLAAQAHDHQAHGSPYAGATEAREIKALSPDEVQGFLAGEGLGFALAAELNGLPGPRHVLDLAHDLSLTPEQRVAVEDVYAGMSEQAQELGTRLVGEERHLDHMFADGHAVPSSVTARTAEIGRIRGELRAVHLVAHLETAEILTAEQVEAYGRLRGYEGPKP